MRDQTEEQKHLRLGGYKVRLPMSVYVRVAIGAALIVGGIFGWLPILGFWMIPLGFLILSYDIPVIARWRDRIADWWARRREKRDRRSKR
jgi:hypothetical protein